MTVTEIIALIASFTAIGTAVILPRLKSRDGFKVRKLDDAESIRNYMKTELEKRDAKISNLETDVKEALKETQRWRDLYYEQLAVNNKQAIEISTLREDNKDLNDRVGQLQKLVSKNAGIVQDNANMVSGAMETAKEEIKKI